MRPLVFHRIIEHMFEARGLTDDSLLDVLLAAERRIAAAQAEQLTVIAELADRCPQWMTAPQPGCPALHPIEVAAAEIGPALRLSKRTAQDRVQIALDVTERLPRSLDALAVGRLSMSKLRILLDHTAGLSPEAATAVESAVLVRVGTDTPAAFGARVRRAVIVADPTAARERVRRAIRERRVDLFPDVDGMAVLRAILPAAAALRAFQLLTAEARSAAHEDRDERGIDACRADTLVEVIDLLDAADAADADGGSGDAPETPGPTGRAPNVQPSCRDADQSLRAAAAAATAPPALAGRPRWGARPVCLYVTVPWTTVAGLSEEPGELAGYGPLDAEEVRRLAADATWRRILTDPASGTVRDVGVMSYHPPAGLDALVRTRDRTCRFPTCRQPASRADLDHTVPFPTGPTAERNLAALCRPHHRLKTLSRWSAEQLGDGRLRWTSPTGRDYVTDPPPAHPPDLPPEVTDPSDDPPF